MPYVWIPKKRKDTHLQRVNNPEKISQFYSDKVKLNTVATYISTGGNNRLTAELCGLDERRVRAWRTTNWWKEFEEELRNQELLDTNQKLKQVLDKSLNLVMDRLENGDTILDSKTGTLKRVPMKGREIHRVSMDTLDKKILIEKLNMTKQQAKTVETQKDKLLKIAEEFAKIATGKSATPNLIEDAVVVVNDIREASQPLQGDKT
jgi:hypothetical protein